MDWTNKSNFLKWIVGILLVLNIATVTIIWTHILDKEPPRSGFVFRNDNRPPDPTNLMQRELNLSEDQVKLFDEKRNKLFEATNKLFTEMTGFQNKLTEQLLDQENKSVSTDSIINQIGLIQAKLEKLRFDHFKELMAVCTPEQKEKFAQILKRIFEKRIIGVNPEPGFPRRWDGPGEELHIQRNE